VEQVYALASYSKSLAVYLDPRAQMLCLLEGQRGGITQIQFTPDGSKLLAGGRKDDEISVWDMRNPGELFAVLKRKVDTNQRIYFDIDPNSRYVVSGSTDGSLRIWDFNKDVVNIVTDGLAGSEAADGILPEMSGKVIANLHNDCINGVSLHPWLPYMATSSGQRHVDFPMLSDDEEEEDLSESLKSSTAFENTFKLWSIRK
jgi:WD40 repeat protein